jgi:multidrug resistance efflux pump
MNGGAVLHGRVERIARGIADQDNRDGPELLATVHPTFTWMRLAQRVPVRVRLTDVPKDTLISAGMTCRVIVNDAAKLRIGAAAKRVLAALL